MVAPALVEPGGAGAQLLGGAGVGGVEAVGLEGDEGVGVLREAAGHRGGEAGVLRLGAQDGFGELEVEGGGVAGEV